METNNTTMKAAAAAKAAAHQGYPELKEIRQDFIALKKDTSDLAIHLKDDGMSHMEDAKDYVTNRFDQLQDSGRKQIRVLEARVKAKPVQTLAAAFAIGMITSYLMGRR